MFFLINTIFLMISENPPPDDIKYFALDIKIKSSSTVLNLVL
jgi:hypothetical protein